MQGVHDLSSRVEARQAYIDNHEIEGSGLLGSVLLDDGGEEGGRLLVNRDVMAFQLERRWEDLTSIWIVIEYGYFHLTDLIWGENSPQYLCQPVSSILDC